MEISSNRLAGNAHCWSHGYAVSINIASQIMFSFSVDLIWIYELNLISLVKYNYLRYADQGHGSAVKLVCHTSKTLIQSAEPNESKKGPITSHCPDSVLLFSSLSQTCLKHSTFAKLARTHLRCIFSGQHHHVADDYSTWSVSNFSILPR